ncbi:hypothetical protein HPB47_016174 [Ixodes persulcatus]|uniref:Uncharacterized protein n=1 Tax=Ixodes persulcatus TaxID=34615 RepID=A0AC60R0A5_IXOPE|nr:hypothetical protein HPB47_016174 [Ixodes persulcatus]
MQWRRQVPSTKWYTFDCQHGDEECKGNLYQACAIHYHPDPSVHLPFIACMFESSSPNSAYRRCALKSGFDLEVLAKCNTDKEGNDLMVKYAEWTESVNAKKRLDFVPWIRMNLKDKMFSAFTEFKKTFCEEYERLAKATCPDYLRVSGPGPGTNPYHLARARPGSGNNLCYPARAGLSGRPGPVHSSNTLWGPHRS